ncbi:MAG: phage major capsid protein [Armatimonadetes bacterium]|nr:phage major capsid protein [Armatimonadota bacterium]
MNPQIKDLQDKQQALVDESKSILKVAEAGALSEEQLKRSTELMDLMEANKAQIDVLAKLDATVSASDVHLNGPAGRQIESIAGDLTDEQVAGINKIDPRAKFKALTKLAARGTHPFLSHVIDDPVLARDTALAFGYFAMATATSQRNPFARNWCDKNGFAWTPAPLTDIQAAQGQSEGINEDGGFVVPEEFERVLIILREQFGVFRQFAEIVPMGSDTKWSPRHTKGIDASFIGEGGTITKSTPKLDRVNLIAKSLKALSFNTAEVEEDAIIAMGDRLFAEFAYAFVKKEDEVGFTGTALDTDGGIVGVAQALIDEWTVAPGANDGLVLAAGNSYSEITMANFHDVQGVLPQYAERNANWFCHKRFWSVVLMKLALASGGVPAAEIMMGGQKRFLGDPVVISQAMPSVEANSQVPIYHGSLDMAAKLGDRRGITFAQSLDFAFDTDEIAYRATQRFDINVHSVKTPTNDPLQANKLPGPIVGLVMAAS